MEQNNKKTVPKKIRTGGQRSLVILTSLTLWLSFFVCGPIVADAGTKNNHKAALYTILALIQNSYITPMENWQLLGGALSGLETYLPEDQLKTRSQENSLTLLLPKGSSVSINKKQVTHNAYQLIESLSEIYVKSVREFPSLPPQEILHSLIRGIVSTLDSHSTFISVDEFAAMRRKNKGIFGGIGVELIIKNNQLTVVSPFEGTPAHLAGLQANDRIISIDDQPTTTMSLLQAVGKIRGPGGTKVKLAIQRRTWPKPMPITIVRETTTLHSIKAKFIVPGIAYLQIISFLSTSFEDTQKALHDLSLQEEIKGLILDLRNNPGGLLHQSEQIADMFIDRGMIVFSRGKEKEQDVVYEAHQDHKGLYFPIVVLVNEGSASGSEIVAASLKEHNRAVIVGNRTFGKGTIQTIFPVLNGAALRLTTAEFFTPEGNKIETVGVLPHVVIQTPSSPLQTQPRDLQQENEPQTIVLNQDDNNTLLAIAIRMLQCAYDNPYEICLQQEAETFTPESPRPPESPIKH